MPDAGPASSPSEFDRFRTHVLAHPALQEALRAARGQSTSFIAEVTRLGHALGYRRAAADVRAALDAGRRAWRRRDAF